MMYLWNTAYIWVIAVKFVVYVGTLKQNNKWKVRLDMVLFIKYVYINLQRWPHVDHEGYQLKFTN